MRKFDLYFMITLLSAIVIIFAIGLYRHGPITKNPPASIPGVEARILIFDGDTLEADSQLKNKFVMILGRQGVVYTDTSNGVLFTASYSNLEMFGPAHKKAILDRIKL